MEIFSTKGVSFPNAYPKVFGAQDRTELSMRISDPRHMTPGVPPVNPERVPESFASMLGESLRRVEELDVNANKLAARAVYEPDSVEAHEVVIAAEKARFAVNFTKTMADGFVRAYRDLTNPR